ncbi:MAG TPA: phosphotransferase family protein [Acidimicrobiales bacterium]|nr:phosphotransferase family protein [Acidimicrobiales bacterium]
MTATLAEGLRGVLAEALGDPGLEVEGVVRLSGGASRETWSFDARRSDGSVEQLILRRDPPGAPKGGMGIEAAVITAAAGAGVPVPRLVAASDETAALGSAFIVVERIEGETIPRRVLREPALAAARRVLAEQCGQILAALHSVPPEAVPGLQSPDQLEQYRQVLDGLGQPSPAFELAFRWLGSNRPPPTGEAIVHGDFRNGNLLIGPDGVRAVLDWELVHLGDPMEDLGWLCVKSWRFGVDRPVGGFGTYEQLISGYEAGGGRKVDRDALRWWEVLGNLKWGIMCMMQASAHLSGALRSVELAAIGRRVCEVEWDLLDLIPGDSGPDVSPSPGPGPLDAAATRGLHGAPSAAELAQALHEFLDGDVRTSTEGRVSFHARVAANVAAMIERELILGPAQAEAHRAALEGLGVADDRRLAQGIRTGAIEGPELRRVLRATVRAKLEVANPRWLEPPRPPGD